MEQGASKHLVIAQSQQLGIVSAVSDRPRPEVHRLNAAINLHETPLSKNQRLADYDDEQELLEASVTDTIELRAWLHSYGDMLEVLEPKALRREFASAAKKLAARYRG
jgi:predicted DNA-binding transcriptional regulator YafY